jgi:hypothetical protein
VVSGWLATEMDSLMLSGKIAPKGMLDSALPIRSGNEVADELHGRMLIRYAIDAHETPRSMTTYVCPTPLSTEELSAFLALPRPDVKREYAILLDPTQIDQVQGPRWCAMGQGIEYVLPAGYQARAVVAPGWGVRIR